MLCGFSLGLIVSTIIYMGDRGELNLPATPTPAIPIPSQSRIEPAPEIVPATHPATRFDFYEILPKFEVVIPEAESEARIDRTAPAVEEPDSYVLQAGSFRESTDAERMQEILEVLGIQSSIQKVTIDTDDFHRVRIGPTNDLDELNEVRRQLWNAQIDSLLIKILN
jgi:cell division protein FtsN